MAAVVSKRSYTRKEACRLVKISERTLRSWEAQHLIAPAEEYGFKELVALRTIVKLRAAKRPVAQIARAIDALTDKLKPVESPLTDLKIYAQGRRIRVELDSGAMDAESGQLLLNFDQTELSRMLEFRAPSSAAAERAKRASAERWFTRGLELEQQGAPPAEIIEAYQKAIELDPNSPGALVNLGTLYFNARDWRKAETYYRRALEADPEYALAHFDLANLYDERGDRNRAMEHYQAALRISPNYADAHYNLALLYQGSNQPMSAVRHWAAYLRLDPSSHWANIARRELAKLREAALVRGTGG